MKSIEWWRGSARHMWRTYFALMDKLDQSQHPPAIIFDMKNMSPADRKIYQICGHIYNDRFVKADQDILRMYFTSRWGDDLYTVEEYSARHNIPDKVIWIVINKACRMAMEETGILDRKDGENRNACD